MLYIMLHHVAMFHCFRVCECVCLFLGLSLAGMCLSSSFNLSSLGHDFTAAAGKGLAEAEGIDIRDDWTGACEQKSVALGALGLTC